MMSNKDRLMSEGPATPSVEVPPGVAFTTPTEGEKSLEAFFAWANGMQPAKRAVPVYARFDLLAERDILKDDLDTARLEENDEAADEILARIKEINLEMQSAKWVFVVQRLTESKRQELLTELDGHGYSDEEMLLRSTHAHIVEPFGVPWETFAQITELAGEQVAQISLKVASLYDDPPNVRLTSPF